MKNSTFNKVYANMAESNVHSNHMVFHFPSFFWVSHINNYQDVTETDMNKHDIRQLLSASLAYQYHMVFFSN